MAISTTNGASKPKRSRKKKSRTAISSSDDSDGSDAEVKSKPEKKEKLVSKLRTADGAEPQVLKGAGKERGSVAKKEKKEKKEKRRKSLNLKEEGVAEAAGDVSMHDIAEDDARSIANANANGDGDISMVDVDVIDQQDTKPDPAKSPTSNSPPAKQQPESESESRPVVYSEEAFEALYLKRVTAALADDLDKVRQAPDFTDRSLPMLVMALKQGAGIFSLEEKKRMLGVVDS